MTDLIKQEKSEPIVKPSAAVRMLTEQVKMLEMCKTLADHYTQTDLVPKQYKQKPGDAAVAIQWGGEIGLSPLQALQNIAVINGNPSLWGDSLVALVRGSGHCEYLHNEWDAETQTATCYTMRKGEQREEMRSFSINDAKLAGLAHRDTYKKFPQRMLTNRARSYLLRDVYADILKGLRIREVEEEDQQFKKPEKDITPRQSDSLNSMFADKPVKADSKPKREKTTETIEEAETTHSEPPVNDLDLIRDHIKTVTDKSGIVEAQEMFRAAQKSGKYDDAQLRGVYNEINQVIEQLKG